MLKNITLTFVSKLLIGVLNLFVIVLLSRYLGAAGKGQASLILTSVTLFLIACNIIGGATLVYLVPRYSTNALLIISYAWTLFSCISVYAVIHFLSLLPVEFEKHIMMLAMLDSFFSINNTILLGKQKIKSVNTLSFIKSLSVATILFLFLGASKNQTVEAYIYTLYISFSLTFLLSLILVFNNREVINSGKSMKDLLVYSFKIGGINQMGHILQFSSLRLSYYLLSRYSGNSDLGIYSNGVSLAESVWLISNSISTVQYAKIANTKDEQRSVQLTLQLTKVSLVLCLAAVTVMALLPTCFYTTLLGSEFSNIKQVIYTLIPGILFYNTALIIGHYFSGIGKYEVEVWGNFAGFIITLGLSAFAIMSGYTYIWAGLISSISYLTTSVVILIYFYKKHRIKFSSFIPSLSDFNVSNLNK